MKLRQSLSVAATLLLAIGCSKPENFVYFHPIAKSLTYTQDVKQVSGNNSIDMFWAIGGMTEQSANFQAGVNQFMQTFVQKKFSWRMAVVSSNTVQPPFLGMPRPFDATDLNPVQDFVSGVVAALSGEDNEMIFDPVAQNLMQNPSFVRPNATLAVILTNDNPDESMTYKSATQLLATLASLKGGDAKKVIVYGIFGATDLNCQVNTIDADWNFHGTEFEKLITMTGGEAYSLCDTSFGAALAKVGDSLYQKLEYPKITLPERADPNTVEVFYEGVPLPGGDASTGALWFFDVPSNSVVFYNLTFAKLDTDHVTVNYKQYLSVQ